jgi:isopentenyl diphosphate isomerase/L-lactate dehydrogenase-like FMN-dependent dehydrogenase
MRPIKSVVDTSTSLFGHSLKLPIFVSPAGVHCVCDPEGECATARACGRVGTLFGLSQHSTKSIEEVAKGAPPDTLKFYQSYILKDRALTLRLVQRAIRAGYKGFFLTVDSVRFGFREADKRNGFNALPHPHRLVNYDEPVEGTSSPSCPSHTTKYNNADQSHSVASASAANTNLDSTYNSKQHDAWDQNTEALFDTECTWDDVTWLKREACGNLPLIVKGIMTAEDALLAIEAGADGIMVSNHGGRQLDGCLATIDVLGEVVAAVNAQYPRVHYSQTKIPILLDGGFMRGTDVLKALAMGATAVGVGKPVFFSLAVGGEDSVVHMFDMLSTELQSAMALCGCQSVADITPHLVTRHPSSSHESSVQHYIRSSL